MVVAKTAKHSIKRSHQLTNPLVVSVVVVTVVVIVIATREIVSNSFSVWYEIK